MLIDEADAWKWKQEIAACKAVYEQWAEVFAMATPKIMSAGDTLYTIKMENASVIRFNCRKMMEMVGCAQRRGRPATQGHDCRSDGGFQATV